MEDVTGAEDMMTVVKGTTGAEKGTEATKNIIRSEGAKGERASERPPACLACSVVYD
jgi:hypothetical protein